MQAPETTAEPAAKLDPDSDEIREKFRIVRVRRLAELAVNSHVLEASPSNNFCALQMQDVVQCQAGTVCYLPAPYCKLDIGSAVWVQLQLYTQCMACTVSGAREAFFLSHHVLQSPRPDSPLVRCAQNPVLSHMLMTVLLQ